jgi:hypothetical protein
VSNPLSPSAFHKVSRRISTRTTGAGNRPGACVHPSVWLSKSNGPARCHPRRRRLQHRASSMPRKGRCSTLLQRALHNRFAAPINGNRPPRF